MREPLPVQHLLGLNGHQERVEWLERCQPLDAVIEDLLSALVSSVGLESDASRESLLAVAHVADASGLEEYGAQARYSAAQGFAANGQLNIALNLIEAAREGFARQGKTLDEMRTHIGRITVLAELGHYAEALSLANEVVDTVSAMVEPRREFKHLRCLALLNKGSCFWHMGSHSSALAAFAASEAGLKKLGAVQQLPAVANNRGLVLMEMGRIREAMEAFLFTAEAAEAAQTEIPRGQALANAARASSLLGEFADGLARYAESRSLLQGLAATDEAIILREMADLYLSLNLYDEARSAYEESIERFRVSGARRHLGWALWGLGAYGIATGDSDQAARHLEEAILVFTETDNAMSLSGVLLERSSLNLQCGNREAAHADACQALALVAQTSLSAPKAFAHLRIAEALWHEPALARPHLLEAELLSQAIGVPHLLFRCRLRMGQWSRLQNRNQEACEAFENAVDELERLRGRIPQEAVRASFMGDKAEAYEEWVGILLETGQGEAAFNAAERAKSRTLVDILNGASGICPTALPSDDRGQELHRELMAVYNRLLGSDPEPHGMGSIEALHKRARLLEDELQRFSLQSPRNGVVPEGLLESAEGGLSLTSSWEDIAASIPSATALVEYFCTGGDVVAFVAHSGTMQATFKLCRVEAIQTLGDRLSVQMQRFEAQGQTGSRHREGLVAASRRVLNELYTLLVEPIRERLLTYEGSDASGWIIVPHGPLHRLPFHAFCDQSGRYLLESYEISYAPSATVFAHCQRQPETPVGDVLLVGSESDILPSILEELDALKQLFPEATVLRGQRATLDALRSALNGQDLVHLACHGVFRSDNPLYSALQLSDGWVTAAEMLSWNLRGAMVTLSACESGRSDVRGADELIGFTRAALVAGAASVLVSGWRVDDRTTAQLMKRFYAGLCGGEGKAAALRSAQLEALAEHPHPWHWAPFSLSGKR